MQFIFTIAGWVSFFFGARNAYAIFKFQTNLAVRPNSFLTATTFIFALSFSINDLKRMVKFLVFVLITKMLLFIEPKHNISLHFIHKKYIKI